MSFLLFTSFIHYKPDSDISWVTYVGKTQKLESSSPWNTRVNQANLTNIKYSNTRTLTLFKVLEKSFILKCFRNWATLFNRLCIYLFIYLFVLISLHKCTETCLTSVKRKNRNMLIRTFASERIFWFANNLKRFTL